MKLKLKPKPISKNKNNGKFPMSHITKYKLEVRNLDSNEVLPLPAIGSIVN